jgi:hypothetical protein
MPDTAPADELVNRHRVRRRSHRTDADDQGGPIGALDADDAKGPAFAGWTSQSGAMVSA